MPERFKMVRKLTVPVLRVEKDYTKYSFRITFLVILIMLGISLIPPFTIGGRSFRRANIISSIYEFGDEAGPGKEAVINAADKAFIKEMEESVRKAKKENAAADEPGTKNTTESTLAPEVWDIRNNGALDGTAQQSSNGISPADVFTDGELVEKFAGVIPIEDFSAEGSVSLKDFCALLGTATEQRVVRIGFLGDSFIEGDIFTADVREQLQTSYGGRGVGFVPFSTPLAEYRPTIKHTFSGWKNYNLIQKKSAPEDAQDRFFVSGTLSASSGKASSAYECSSFRRHLNSVSSVRLLFTNTKDSGLTLTVNDTIQRAFAPETGEQVQQIHITGSGIKKLRVSVSEADGFYGYGVVLESTTGVSVDNYSIRSNSGLPLFGTNGPVNRHINRMLGYDMIVLQYGLNIMEADVTNYTNYGVQFRKVVNYVKSCFPNAVIVIMGVGDRSTMKNGVPVTMPGVKPMLEEQRQAAIECGVCFWNTFEAMGGENSMGRFVNNGWAAKDYTHLGFNGGRKIASEFVKAIEFTRTASEGRIADDSLFLQKEKNTDGSRAENIETFHNDRDGETGTDNRQADSTSGKETSLENVTGVQHPEPVENLDGPEQPSVPAVSEQTETAIIINKNDKRLKQDWDNNKTQTQTGASDKTLKEDEKDTGANRNDDNANPLIKRKNRRKTKNTGNGSNQDVL